MTYRVYVQGNLDTRPPLRAGWRIAPGMPGSVHMIEFKGDTLVHDRAGVWIDDVCYPWWRVVQIERVRDDVRTASSRRPPRCTSTEPGFTSTRCQRNVGHDGKHIYTSQADGMSVTWE